MRLGFHALPADAAAQADPALVERFTDMLNDDLNLPRALAVAWEALRGDAPAAVKRATLAKFDEVLGLGLAAWQPRAVEVPADIEALAERARGRPQGEALGGSGPAAQGAGDAGWEVEDRADGHVLKRETRRE